MMLFQTATSLSRERFETVVISLQKGGQLAARLRDNGIKVIEIGIEGQLSWVKLFSLFRLMRKEKPHIVHAYMFHADFSSRIFGRLARVPIIISSIRNENIGGRLRERLLGVTKHMADCVTAVCKAAGERQVKQGAVSKQQLQILYNGVEMGRFAPPPSETLSHLRGELGIPARHFVYITVGRMVEQKNHLGLLESFASVVRDYPDSTLVIAGDGKLRPRIEARVTELGLQGHVRCLGVRQDIPQLLHMSDAFVLSSNWEGFPNVVLEAMASGKPVVATQTGGVAELVDDGETGYVVAPDNPAAMTAGLLKLAALSSLDRSQMGNRALVTVKERFTLERTLEQTVELYDSLLRRKGVLINLGEARTG
ncbi:glycosyltransferase [Paenibacillus sp. R14(2021)]|uniref:glycosyltransferase n=1 Tax=Paenibacillus sp. R14(2021) TaxID=2859228 RepID=UPI001C6147C8|nr:glycosyltransferase [Paenibacillus sp. R14(2021)]